MTTHDHWSELRPTRRFVLEGGAAGLGAFLLGSRATASGRPAASALGFEEVGASGLDRVVVPPGYIAEVFLPWGTPLGAGGESEGKLHGAMTSAVQQAKSVGTHHDGMRFFPFPERSSAKRGREQAGGGLHGLLCINHEYLDDGLLHENGREDWSADKVATAQAAVGVSVVEVRETEAGGLAAVPGSKYSRRITADTEVEFSGDAAGHAWLETGGDVPRGTFANCAHGWTPWGTYLTCEENFQYCFSRGPGDAPDRERAALERNYGIGVQNPKAAWRAADRKGNLWWEHDERFLVGGDYVNEPNRFGWVVEIDPFDPDSKPIKHTCLGRFAHENACVVHKTGQPLVVYMGDDSRHQFLYKFVSTGKYRRGDHEHNRGLLHSGVLHVAKLADGGGGVWIPLVAGEGLLRGNRDFADQGQVLINARGAAAAVGATPLDRPEWVVWQRSTQRGFVSLTNNSRRTELGPGSPHAPNPYGHVLSWQEAKGLAGTEFTWDILVHGGPSKPGQPAFGSPDGLFMDDEIETLWMGTDVSADKLLTGDHYPCGNNQLLTLDPASGDVRRFLVGPRGAEITGCSVLPGGRILLVNVQHPGEDPRSRPNDPANPRRYSSWPNLPGDDRPRSATLVVRRKDGGRIGS